MSSGTLAVGFGSAASDARAGVPEEGGNSSTSVTSFTGACGGTGGFFRGAGGGFLITGPNVPPESAVALVTVGDGVGRIDSGSTLSGASSSLSFQMFFAAPFCEDGGGSGVFAAGFAAAAAAILGAP